VKINFKAGNKRFTIDFSISPGISSGAHFVAMAKSSKELDTLQDYISSRGSNDDAVALGIAKAIEQKLKLPIEPVYGYQGAGYGLKIDLYSVATKLR
jgi:hypothetical protein